MLKEALAKLILGCHQLTTWVFITSITNKPILDLEVLHTHKVSVDLACYVLQLANTTVVQPCSSLYMKCNSVVVVTCCCRIVTVHMEGPLELADRATHQAGACT
jgi:hypothetical protein